MPMIFHPLEGFQVGGDALKEGSHEKWSKDELGI